MKKNIFFICVIWGCCSFTDGHSQARLVLDGASMVISQGAYLVIDNPAADAITRNTGFLLSEGENNLVKWDIGTSIDTYTVPWGYGTTYIPLTFTKTAGIGDGHFLFSTYHTGWENSAELPTGVANMNGASGLDNSAFASDRFWQINAQNYTTKPTLSALAFTYIDAENSAVGNTINQSNLRANRYNSSLSSWTDYILESTLNTTSNTVTVTSVDTTNLRAWWVVGTLGANLYWVAPSNSISNLSANWSLTSGGLGDAGIPSIVDALIFDENATANSTIDVNLNVGNLVVDAGYIGTITQGLSEITITNVATLSGGTFTGGSGNIVVGGAFTLSGTDFTSTSDTLELKENLIINSGTFAHNNGTVKFSGAVTQSVSGSVVNTFNHISVTNAAANPGVTIENDQNLVGILTLDNNVVVDADGTSNTAVFRMISSGDEPTNDAAIGILPTGARVTGNVTLQRFMTKQGRNNNRIYRYISSPVQQGTVADLQNEIPVTGSFIGSSTCPGCAANSSLFYYNETVITDINGSGISDLNDGYVTFPGAVNTETFTPGLGYALFTRGDILASTLWDLRGEINTGNVTPITFPVSYTSSESILNDGWNLIGNPFPSTIDWNASAGWTKTNLGTSIYISDNGSADDLQHATWNGTLGTNGGSRYIATGQGFWVKADGSGTPVLAADENVKAPAIQTTFFRKDTPDNVVRITLAKGDVRDETVIHFRKDATPDFDSHADALKLVNGTFNLSSVIQDGTQLAINSLSSLDCRSEIRLGIDNINPGIYELLFSELNSFTSGVIVELHDKFLDQTTPVENNNKYTFTVSSNTGSFGSDRFTLIISEPEKTISIEVIDNILAVPFSEGIQWYFNGEAVEDATHPSIQVDESGIYKVVVLSKGCTYVGEAEMLITGIESTFQYIKIYPNPVEDELIIEFPGTSQSTKVLLINMLGQVFDSKEISQQGVFDMSHLPGGVYTIQITHANKVTTKKIVKQ